jgi:COP9 signalosome complex subunit 1
MIQLLTSVPSAPRSTLQGDALKTAKEYEREARRRIQHMNIAGAELEIKGAKGRGNNQLSGLDDMNWGGMASNTRELRSRHGGF